MLDGQERPIAYASRTLTVAERGYSQIEKEGLAVVYAVTKFHNYLYGRKFLIESDHQPLSHLFNQQKAISTTASARTQRWALTLSAYHYTICHKPGRSLSRCIEPSAKTHHNISSSIARKFSPSTRPSVSDYIHCCLH